jgi:hypothetical protein
LIDNYVLTVNFTTISRNDNQQVDSLAVSTNLFKPPIVLSLKYEVEVLYKPSIPYNIKHWQVFEHNMEIRSRNRK